MKILTNKIFLISVAALLVAGGVYFFFFRTPAATADSENPALVRRVVKVERKDLKVEVSATGTVQPVFKIDIKSKASGEVLTLKLNEGDFIKKGDLIATIERTDALSAYNQAKANLDVAVATLKQIQSSNTRKLELFKEKLISNEEMDLATLELERAKAQLVSAKAVFEQAQIRLSDTSVRSPMDGLVLDKLVDEGQVISSGTSSVTGGTTIVTIADMEKVYINAAVDEVDIGKIFIGQKARVIADAYPEETFSGKVLRIDPLATVEQNVTRFNVVTEVENRNNKLKAGMNTTVTIVIADKKDVVVVPIDALRDPKAPPPGGFAGGSAGGNGERRRGNRDSTSEGLATETPDSVRQKMKARRAMRDSLAAVLAADSASGNTVRRRLVMLKDAAGEFKPQLVEVGATNFDETEITSGLKEGDELLIVTFSRARMQGQQFQQAVRQGSGLGAPNQRQVRQSTR